jgi:hypothetical protein
VCIESEGGNQMGRWKDNVKVELKKIGYELLDFISLPGHGPV